RWESSGAWAPAFRSPVRHSWLSRRRRDEPRSALASASMEDMIFARGRPCDLHRCHRLDHAGLRTRCAPKWYRLKSVQYVTLRIGGLSESHLESNAHAGHSRESHHACGQGRSTQSSTERVGAHHHSRSIDTGGRKWRSEGDRWKRWSFLDMTIRTS